MIEIPETASTDQRLALAVDRSNELAASGEFREEEPQTRLQLPGGRMVMVPTALLLEYVQQDGAAGLGTDRTAVGSNVESIPVIEERLEVGKRTIVTGKVVLEKHVQEYTEALDVPLAVRAFDVERVVLNRPVEAAPAVRHEGATTIYPVVEEQVVVTTQLVLREEIHVTQRDTERRDTRPVTLKREVVTVTRVPGEK